MPPPEDHLDRVSAIEIQGEGSSSSGERGLSSDDAITVSPEKSNAEIRAGSSSTGISLDSRSTPSPEKSTGEIGRASSGSSDGVHAEIRPFDFSPHLSGDSSSEPDEKRRLSVHAQNIALGWHEWNLLFSAELTEEEKENGFKWLSRPNPKYLGFVPGENDKRRYLNVVPLVHAEPDLSFLCYLPVSWTQRWAVMIFALVSALFAAGVIFYFHQVTVGS